MNGLQRFLDGRSDRLTLKILAKVHVATRRQLCAFLKLSNPIETEAASDICFSRLTGLGLLSMKTYGVQSGRGEVRTRAGCPTLLTDVYFLTGSGAECAENIYNGIGRFARPEEPTGVHKLRLYHDLLICEALLHACSLHNVTDFQTEAELKSEIFHSRNAYKTAENTGDFRVHYVQAALPIRS